MEVLEGLKFVGAINVPVIIATTLLSWPVIKFLKKGNQKFPFRQVVPFLVAIVLTIAYAFSMGDGMDRSIIWNSFLTALIATGAFVKIKSFLKDRGIKF